MMEFFQRTLKLWKYWPWILLGTVALIFFTVLKVPDAKLKGLIQGHLNQALYQSGISMTAAESNLSFIFGPRYIMKQVQVRWTPDSPPVVFDEIRVAPSVWSLMLGRFSGKATVTAQKGTLTVSGHLTGNRFGADVEFDSMDIGKAGLLKALAKIDAAAMVDGDLHLSGNIETPTTISGASDLRIEKLSLPAQSIAGFQVPASSISKSVLKINVKNGRAECTECLIGTKGSADDLVGVLKGSVDIAKYVGASRAQLEATFRISEKLKSAFVFLDSLLPQGCVLPDGSYGLLLTGTLEFLTMGPMNPR